MADQRIRATVELVGLGFDEEQADAILGLDQDDDYDDEEVPS